MTIDQPAGHRPKVGRGAQNQSPFAAVPVCQIAYNPCLSCLIHEIVLLFHAIYGKVTYVRLTDIKARIMATLQVKGMDDRLYKALGARAAMENRSISQEVVAMIHKHLASPARDLRETGRAILELAGSWQDDRSAGKIARDIRRSRRYGRRFKELGDVFA
jgi:plasmid stability protein